MLHHVPTAELQDRIFAELARVVAPGGTVVLCDSVYSDALAGFHVDDTFNPVDPALLLYCYEGTWHELDRTWTIRADGTAMRLMHKRTMDMEINGHEWWSWDGRTVWFDLQTPRSQVFWLAGVNVETGKETRYHVERSWWGVHFNSSRDDSLFASDGGDPSQVAYASDGMWINLFRVQPDGTLTATRINVGKDGLVPPM